MVREKLSQSSYVLCNVVIFVVISIQEHKTAIKEQITK